MPEALLQSFPDILKYGATGLSALLFFFAYLLLREQCKKKDSDPKVLREIRIYMFISVILAGISLISSIFCSPNDFSPIEEFSIIGTVKKEDGEKPVDITIIRGHPVLTASPDGEIIGLDVWRNPQGKLPILMFSSSGYFGLPVDLNKYDEIIHDNDIDIGEVILMSVGEIE